MYYWAEQKETHKMLKMTKWLRSVGARPLCALRMALGEAGKCECVGVRRACDEVAREVWKAGGRP